MNFLLTMLFICFLPLKSFAGSSEIIIAFNAGEIPVNSTIEIPAEYVAMPVKLSSDEDDKSKRAILIQTLQSNIFKAVSAHANIRYEQGIVSFSTERRRGYFKSNAYKSGTQSKLYLLSKVGEGIDIFAATQAIYDLIARIKKPDSTRIDLGSSSLAIRSPEQYRQPLLQKIRAQIAATKTMLGASYKISVAGLEKPVSVRQLDDRNVVVFLNYRVEYRE